jgi:hypothetical protein
MIFGHHFGLPDCYHVGPTHHSNRGGLLISLPFRGLFVLNSSQAPWSVAEYQQPAGEADLQVEIVPGLGHVDMITEPAALAALRRTSRHAALNRIRARRVRDIWTVWLCRSRARGQFFLCHLLPTFRDADGRVSLSS